MPIKPLSTVEIGKRIRGYRRARGLTLAALAQRAGLPMQHLDKIEQGLCDPTASVADSIARSMGLTIGDFLAPRDTLSDAAQEFLELYPKAPNGVRQALAQILRASIRQGATRF